MGKISGILAVLIFCALIAAGIIIYNSSIIGNVIDHENATIILVMFYGQGCPHCAKEEAFLKTLAEEMPIKVEEFEVYSNQENRKLFEELSDAYGTSIQGVPTLFIGDKVIIGFSDAIGRQIKQEVELCIKEGCNNPLEKLNDTKKINATQIIGESSSVENPEKEEIKKKLTISAVISAAFVDSINPCEFAILIILLSTILSAGSRKKALLAGLAFTLAIYISYLLMGLGLYSAIKISGFSRIFYIIVSILAIIIGLFNLKDYFWYGRWFLMEVPLTWRPRMKMLLKSITSIPGAFLIGFVISLFLLPCTSGPYIVILSLLSEVATRNYALALLFLYNFIFILPMLALTFIIAFGFATTQEAEEWRQKKLRTLHLITGIIILLLGIGMLIALKLGWV